MTKYLLFMILVLATFLAVSVKNCQDRGEDLMPKLRAYIKEPIIG